MKLAALVSAGAAFTESWGAFLAAQFAGPSPEPLWVGLWGLALLGLAAGFRGAARRRTADVTMNDRYESIASSSSSFEMAQIRGN